MSPTNRELRPHFIFRNTGFAEPFQAPRKPVDKPPLPALDRHSHGQTLLAQLDVVKQRSEEVVQAQQTAGLGGGFGLILDFQSQPDIELAFESLAREGCGIELLNVKKQ